MQTKTTFELFMALAKQNVDEHGEGVLGQETLIIPPVTDIGYSCTPRNALIFGTMGVDGVHYVILQLDGKVQEHSPVLQISPMDFDQEDSVIASSFLDYLAYGCNVAPSKIATQLTDSNQAEQLVKMLATHFKHERLLQENRLEKLGKAYKHLIEKQTS